MNLNTHLPFRLNALGNQINKALNDEYERRFDISSSEFHILASLAERQPQSAQQVGEATQLDKTKVSRAVHRLVDKGLLIRKQDPRDKRYSVLKLSARGRDISKKAAKSAQAWEDRILDKLGQRNTKILTTHLDSIQNVIQKA